VHRASNRYPGTFNERWLLPGAPAAHAPICLPLLPSGPDGVQHRHVAQDLTINAAHSLTAIQNTDSQTWNSTPL